ncbi:MAG: hypothetical protein K6L80_02140 [Agarilytica sp.]
MMLRPSPAVTRLAEMRARANQLGLSVRIPSSGAGNESIKGCIYSIPLSQRVRKNELFENWTLKRLGFVHEIHFYKHWDWGGDGRPLKGFVRALPDILDGLPEGITLIECNKGGLGVLWDESRRGDTSEGAVDKIHVLLKSLTQAMDQGMDQK